MRSFPNIVSKTYKCSLPFNVKILICYAHKGYVNLFLIFQDELLGHIKLQMDNYYSSN